jgi:hypothetical protein
MKDILALANLLQERNRIDEQISKLIQRPATQGHIGEFIASQIFGIRLMESATNKAIDGHFMSGALAGRSVDVKFYGKQEGLLAVQEDEQPDYFLVLTGPCAAATSSKGKSRLCVIDHVYLFSGPTLAEDIRWREVAFGVAVSIPRRQWDEAEIYPVQTNKALILTESQKAVLSKLGSSGKR